MNLMDIWNKVAKPAGNWVNDNVIQPTVSDFTDFGKGVGYAFTPQRTWDAVRTAIDPNAINKDSSLRNRLANDAPSPVSAKRIATSGLGVISTLAPIPGNKFVSSLSSPLARVAAGSLTRGAAAAIPSAARTYIETEDPYQALRSGAISGGTAGLLNVAFSPKATGQGLIQLWNKVAGSSAAPAAASTASKVVSKNAPITIMELTNRVRSGTDNSPVKVAYERAYGGGTDMSDILKGNGRVGGTGTFNVSDPANKVVGNQYGGKVMTGKLSVRPSEIYNFDLSKPSTSVALMKWGEQNGLPFNGETNYLDNVMEKYGRSIGMKAYNKTLEDGTTTSLSVIDPSILDAAGRKAYTARQNDIWTATAKGEGIASNRNPNQTAFEKAFNAKDYSAAAMVLSKMSPDEQRSIPEATRNAVMAKALSF